ncbi:MAG: UDP-forming cellulose synthase catalytic subunit [Succinatimonas sp.]|nr:UDP-forming cellulose synthase catalytic subunit [Succinatimonas sp.]MDD5869706.1 UDP-forming cellulose synthase catalytic subunit [Succinatimonas sp.]MDY5723013.1 UDP-forming cellulose synthase catalytic subunit [Succinivibrio sp.]
MRALKFLFLFLVALPMLVLVVVAPMDAKNQFYFGLGMCVVCLIAHFLSKKHFISFCILTVAVLCSTRYMYFRITQTLYFPSLIDMIFGILLLLAECYVYMVLLLSFFQLSWSLKRKIVPLPKDTSLWPTVDVYIPTYNEELSVVRDTVLAAQCLEYPKDKMKIYLLDDGKRKEFAAFATEANVGYITRTDNAHAKAGNLNHAMTLTNGELIAIFDCDHITTKIFLQSTVGAFIKDSKLALMQTPHHFYSPDPIQRNLYLGRDIPPENDLFYGPIQRGNDNWNATFFCGSCAVIRRKALDEIGGFAVETVTEDAHTALRLQRRGWKTAFLDHILSGGLATERLVLHLQQRNRWARGMIQIFRLDNPLLGKGLSFAQRLCYLSATTYFFFAVPVLIFLFTPILYLDFGISIVHGSVGLMLAYAFPHLIMSIFANSRLYGNYRYSFWGQIYDLILSFHLVLPTVVTLIFPHKGKFNVTDKGQTVDKSYFDALSVRPHLIGATVLVLSVIYGCVKLSLPEYFDIQSGPAALNIFWAIFNLILLIAAICTGRETANKRKAQRLPLQAPVNIYQASGICSRTTMRDLSMSGCRVDGFTGNEAINLEEDPITDIEIATDYTTICVPVERIQREGESDTYLRLSFVNTDIDMRREFVRLLFSRADTWVRPKYKADNPIRSYFTILACIKDSLFSRRRHDDIHTAVVGGKGE